MQTQVRPVRLRDLPRLRRLFRQAAGTSFSYLKDHHHYIVAQNNLPRLAVAWLRPSRMLIGIYHEDRLKGYAIGSSQGPTAQLYWLYVLPELRGHNAGLQLINASIEHAQRRGAGRMVLATHSHHDYYQRQGFNRVQNQEVHGVPMDIMRLELGGGRG
jgi:GNAT superfamily N-acetyltransferase